ncbi:MAG TPA: disulfide bond formation protein B [Gammaproteobacteria bacterium]|jgi:disulfide bond formation protein DsbB
MRPEVFPMLFQRRQANLLGFLVCAALMGYALYAQFHLHLEPCLLCIFQRVAVIGMGVVFLAAAAHNPKAWGSWVYGILLLLLAIGGSVVSARHIYVQHLPEYLAPPCGPGFGYLFSHLPFGKFLVQAFTGSADCSIVTWRFLGLTMPEWLLGWFVALGLGGFIVNWRKPS